MKRRSFLSLGIGVGGSSLLYNGLPISSRPAGNMLEEKLMSEGEDRVLVLLQLNGGNDGLSTVVPLEDYGRLVKFRPTIIIPENDLITVLMNLLFIRLYRDLNHSMKNVSCKSYIVWDIRIRIDHTFARQRSG